MPNKVNCGGDADHTEHNHKAVKSAAQRTEGNASKMCTDYSIPGKKRESYKKDAD